MQHLSKILRGIVALAFPLTSLPALAGRVSVDLSAVEFVDNHSSLFKPGEIIKIQAKASIYKYGSDQYGYMIFAIGPSSSVGHLSLRSLDESAIVIIPMSSGVSNDYRPGPLRIKLNIRAPSIAGAYDVYYSIDPIFTDKPISLNRFAEEMAGIVNVAASDKHILLRSSANRGSLRVLTRVQISEEQVATSAATPPVYIRVDNKTPSLISIDGGTRLKPLRISWFVGKEYDSREGIVLYRYKLYPTDETWSAWTPATQVEYAFLQRGYHEFRVQARHVKAHDAIESKEARLDFTLMSPLISTVPKALLASPGSDLKSIDVTNLYPRSRALLVGLWEFDDRASFPQFEASTIQGDINAMEDALKANNFRDIVKILKPRLTKDDIETAIGEFVNRATKDDRLIIYFSTHGFVDPVKPSSGYLATSNCDYQNATARCLSLQSLREQAERALGGRGVKQVLFAVDSCFSGLGVVSKAVAVSAPDLSRLAAEGGAYMLTAGMADQKAEIDPRFGKSTFTHFLSKGLQGDADIMEGGVITLGELLLYVQFEVARATESRQIPMLGRILGGGEMLFWPKIKIEKNIELNK